MRKKISTILIFGLSILILFNIFVIESSAQNSNISITEIKHQLTKTTNIGTTQAHYYTFEITFLNTGDTATPNITVYFEDPELNTPLEIQSFTLEPNQNTTIKYEEWPTTLLGNIQINITYDPTSPDILSTPSNSGKEPYHLSIGPTTTEQTPGFQFTIFISCILITTILIKKKRKN